MYPYPENYIIVAKQDLSVYSMVVLFRFEKFGNVTLSASGNHRNEMERLVSLFKNIGLKELKREVRQRNVDDDIIDVLEITIGKPLDS